MDIQICPGLLSGKIHAPASKSAAHRALICAALADSPTRILCHSIGNDIRATVQCLRALGAEISDTEGGFLVKPIQVPPHSAVLPCAESGSTLRFLLPVVGALGVDASFQLEGRLPSRPLSPLWEEMERMGCTLCRTEKNVIRCKGQLRSGEFTIDGSVSSQFITGLLLALPLLPGSHLTVTGEIQSRPYLDITAEILRKFSASGSGQYRSPGVFCVEGDWSNAAFFLSANALGSHVEIGGLDTNSSQGDRAIALLLPQLEAHAQICASGIPDLVPILAVVAACKNGAVFTGIHRLRAKESDRVNAIVELLQALGGHAEAAADTLSIYPCTFSGGSVDSHRDHRIAMAAAIAATIAKEPVVIRNAQCVQKSYPQFWEHFQQLGGQYAYISR